MNYKRIIKSQKVRFKILKLLNFIPDNIMLKIQYKIKTGRSLNLKNPKRYTEKIQKYKIYYRNPILIECVDKYNVRKFVKEKGLSNILNELYGVYDSTDKIDFDKLPNEFILKTTNGSETNIICNDKSKLNIEDTKKKLDFFLNRETINAGREWAYNNVKPLIICEKLLKPSNNADLMDYKFICFRGKVECIIVDSDRFTDHKRNFYDINWNKIEVESDCKNIEKEIKKPKELRKMIKIVEILSKDFPHVRVDLYNFDEKIIFGELTFYPWSGYVNFKPDEFDYKLGKNFNLKSK